MNEFSIITQMVNIPGYNVTKAEVKGNEMPLGEERYCKAFEKFVEWTKKVEAMGLGGFKSVLKTFKHRLWGMLNFFLSGLINGLSEALMPSPH